MKKSVIFILLIFLTACGFEYEKQIVDNYYIIKNEGHVSLSYHLGDGSFVGKIPDQIIQYGFNKRYLVAKVDNFDKTYSYYIIDRKKDFGAAIEENFRIGPIPEEYYQTVLEEKLAIEMIDIEVESER